MKSGRKAEGESDASLWLWRMDAPEWDCESYQFLFISMHTKDMKFNRSYSPCMKNGNNELYKQRRQIYKREFRNAKREHVVPYH